MKRSIATFFARSFESARKASSLAETGTVWQRQAKSTINMQPTQEGPSEVTGKHRKHTTSFPWPGIWGNTRRKHGKHGTDGASPKLTGQSFPSSLTTSKNQSNPNPRPRL